MTTPSPDLTLTLSLSLLVLLLVWSLGWRKSCVDVMLQRLFGLRDDLFIEAAARQNGLALDLPQYRAMREHLNRLIRLCHEMHLPSLLGCCFCLLVSRRARRLAAMDALIDGMPPGPAQKRLAVIKRDAAKIVLHHFLRTSPTFVLLTGALFVVLAVIRVCRDVIFLVVLPSKRGAFDWHYSVLTPDEKELPLRAFISAAETRCLAAA